MTASHIQILPAGPVKLIGLPQRNTLVGGDGMGVINNRAMPRRINNNNNVAGLSSAKRSLFGTPDPGETQKIYEQELQRTREQFIKRYSFDIIKEMFVNQETDECSNGNDKDNDDNDNNDNGKQNNNSIIEDENDEKLKCEQRLHEPNMIHNEISSRDEKFQRQNFAEKLLDSSNKNPSAVDDENNVENSRLSSVSMCASASSPNTGTGSSLKDKKNSSERLKKPYTRQAILTEFYKARKSQLYSPAMKVISVSQLQKPQKAFLHDEQIYKNRQQNSQQNGTAEQA